jgi:hypothetical protein
MAESTIKITAETKQAESSLASLGEKVKQADERFIGLGEAMGTLGAAAVAGGLVELLKSSLETADSMGKMAQKAGISVESLSRLSVAAQLSDVDTQSLASAMGKLDKNMVSAQSGTGAAADAFAALGISVTDAHGKLKSSDEVLAEVADSFHNAGDGAGKTAAAMAIFGKAGADLIPMLNGGSEELDKFGKLADQLGLTLDGQTSQSAQEVKDRFETMGMALKGVGMTVMKDMLPTLDSLSSVLVDSATDADGLQSAADTLSFALKGIVSVGMGVVRTFQALGMEIGGLSAAGVAAAHGEFSQAKAILADLDAEQNEADAKFTARMEKLWASADKRPASAGPKSDKQQIDLKSDTAPAVDPNNAAVLALQNEEFRKQMELLGVAAPQIKVYELAMKGATEAQIQQAQAAAEGAISAESALKAQKDEAAANKITEKSTYDLAKARETTLVGLVDLQLQEKLRQADMLTGIEREQAVAAIQLQIATTNITKQHDLQVAALAEKRKQDEQHHALTAALEKQYQDQRALLDQEYEARLTDAKNAEAEKRMKSELSVANFSQNLRAGDYMNAMTIAEQMSAGLATKSRAAFEVNKAAALAKATVQGYQMIQAAASDGANWGGYVGAIAEGALAVAYVAANLSAISSTQFGGAGGSVVNSSGGGVPSMATSVGVPVSQQPATNTAAQPVTVNIYNTGNVLSPDYVQGTIIPQIKDAVTNNDVVIIDPRSRQAQMLVSA